MFMAGLFTAAAAAAWLVVISVAVLFTLVTAVSYLTGIESDC